MLSTLPFTYLYRDQIVTICWALLINKIGPRMFQLSFCNCIVYSSVDFASGAETQWQSRLLQSKQIEIKVILNGNKKISLHVFLRPKYEQNQISIRKIAPVKPLNFK